MFVIFVKNNTVVITNCKGSSKPTRGPSPKWQVRPGRSSAPTRLWTTHSKHTLEGRSLPSLMMKLPSYLPRSLNKVP